MNIAGLDIATKTGLAVMNQETGTITTDTFMASPKKKKFLDRKDDDKSLDLNHEGALARRFEDYLTVWLLDNDIGYVAIEAPINSSTGRTKEEIDFDTEWAGKSVKRTEVGGTSMATIVRLYGLQVIAASVCSRLNIPMLSVAQGTWRKEFIRVGRHPKAKEMAVEECRRRKIVIRSTDAAEAVGVVHWLDITLNPYSQRRGNDLFAGEKKVPTPEEINERAS